MNTPNPTPGGNYSVEVRHHRRSFFFPLLLIAIGIFFFLSNMGMVKGSGWDIFFIYWPVLLILMGLDGFVQGDHWVGPTVALGLGTVLLLSNLGIIQTNAGWLLLRLWPVLLIALGLDVAFGRRNSFYSVITRLLVAIALVAGIVWFAFSVAGQPVSAMNISQPLQGVSRADVTINEAVGEMTITANPEKTANLVEGSVSRTNTESVHQSFTASDQTGTYRLYNEGNFTYDFNKDDQQLLWKLAFNPSVQYQNADFELAVGKQEINLTGMDVTDLRVTNAVGRTTVTLPQEAKLDGELKTAVGILTIYVPKGASVRIQTDTGLTTRNYPSGWSNNEHTLSSPAAASGTPAYNLNVNVGLGSLEIVELP